MGTLIIFSSIIYSPAVYAETMDNYVNGSTPKNVSINKIITYFNGKPTNTISNIFCVNRDKITYFESFFDEERDYYDLSPNIRLQPDIALTEEQKKINPVSLKIKYEHDPSCYDNPVSVSNLSSNYYDIFVKWNTSSGKWELEDAEDILFHIPTEDKRGIWKISLSGYDSTGKPVFDKQTEGFTTFRVHKAPVPKFKFSENENTISFYDDGSYDYDYMYRKNSHKNNKNDREYSGIKEFYWSVKADGAWVDIGTGTSVQYTKSGKAITDFMLTVEDYDGAKTSISKTKLLLEKPDANFEFLAGSTHTTYFYEGNKGHETITVNPLIAWNDEAFSKELYGREGTQTQTWTALNTMDTSNSTNDFILNILKGKYNSIIKNNLLPVELLAKNKYDYFDTVKKEASILKITTNDLTGTVDTASCSHCQAITTPKMPYLVDTTAKMIYQITNKVNKNDLKIVLSASEAGINNAIIEPSENGSFNYDIPLQDPETYSKAWWDNFSYSFDIYSKRTNELLHQDTGKVYIHTPITVDGYINGSKSSDINNEEPIEITANTPKYAETVTATFPVETVVDGKTLAANTPIYLNTDNSSHTTWSKNIRITESSEDDKPISIQFEAIAYNKRDKATDNINATIVSYRLLNFRVTKVRDLKLENFYKSGNGFSDVEMNVSKMAIDTNSFAPYPIEALTKGYAFEFKIDSINFNKDVDKIVITPSLYAVSGNYRNPTAKKGYWIDSNKQVWEIGTGGHQAYQSIVLTKSNRTLTGGSHATWQGRYLVPGTTFLTENGTSTANALKSKLNADIIVNFHIVGYKGNVPKFDYNIKQWEKERSVQKVPYQIGDVIRYNGQKSNLDDLNVIRNRG